MPTSKSSNQNLHLYPTIQNKSGDELYLQKTYAAVFYSGMLVVLNIIC